MTLAIVPKVRILSQPTMRHTALLLMLFLAGCASIPGNVKPVDSFSIDSYLGRWYEIARLDHWFERGLSQVTAEYRKREDGGISVLNRGFSQRSGEWEEAHGKAYLAGEEGQGFLRVSFFGPFYGAYVICAIDRENYQYALVCGPDTSYLWILARQPMLDRDLLDSLLGKAKSFGYDTDTLIFVDHRPQGDSP